MNQASRQSPVVRFFIGLWDAMNFTRRLIFNILFFGFLLMLLIVIGRGDGQAPLLERTALVIAPEGALVEQYSADPLSRALAQSMGQEQGEVQLRDLLLALDSAAKDKHIERVVLRLDGLGGGGMASRRELAAAIARVRESGKEVLAFGAGMGQGQYQVAAEANEVYLDPMGAMMLEGLGRYRTYYRELLQEKLGVDMHLFKVGEYKSAAEPFVLDAASAEAKEADLYWMNDLWQRYLADVAKARKLDAAAIAQDIEQMDVGIQAAGGDLARYALDQKLVDGLKTREQFDDMLVERGVADEDAEGGFRQIALADYLARVDRSALAAVDPRPQVAVIVAEGEITGGEQPPGSIGGDSTSTLLRQARDDEKVKAVVLRVDSPGGEVFASEQIRREVVALKDAGKPVVVSMGDLAASGGYWISMNADRIYADPSTITGSIGIFGMFPTIPRALDKIGVHSDGVGTTRFAGAFDITRELAPGVGEVVQAVIDKGYRDFTGRVAEARNKPVEQVDEVARGRVWSGAQAKERGLVDAFGGLQDAIDDVAKRAELGERDDYGVRYIEKLATPFERFFIDLAQARIGQALLKDSSLAQALLGERLPQMAGDLRFLEQSARPSAGVPVKSLAHCFCGL
ncbi:signal peptide peptidase SppA [Marilutibacter maris]|uniref:Endopeptidase IV n=1 Tax=Marilutibacter maris TaxID=1605891 RepID=A0A2U9T548_9GAMM|nr:signal peptide peptidase SppA [Lysobacter maris]AWV06104.1 endopeptidase IV [Lysobacter maris]KAB8190457.1 signal peptide peptidase SppA [Lysobacter maris]